MRLLPLLERRRINLEKLANKGKNVYICFQFISSPGPVRVMRKQYANYTKYIAYQLYMVCEFRDFKVKLLIKVNVQKCFS